MNSRLLTLFALFCAMLCAVLLDRGARAAEDARGWQPRIAGRIEARFLTGVSGLAASRRHPGVLWIHNDFAKERYVYAIDTRARLLAICRLQRVESVNWEDIALGPGPASGVDYLYIGDIGDDLRARPEIAVYRFPEPPVSSDIQPADGPPSGPVRDLTPRAIAGAEALRFVYPGGVKYDAEALMVDPASGDLFIVTKELSARARIYRSPAPQAPGRRRVLEYVGLVQAGSPVTAGDISARGDRIVLRTYFQALLWPRPPGTPIAHALQAPARSIPILAEPQGEAIGFDPGRSGFYTLSEGKTPPLYFFSLNSVSLPPDGAGPPSAH